MRLPRTSQVLPVPSGCIFYDAISPIVDADTIDMNVAFRASRYGKSLDGGDDYVNCPFDRDQYEAFLDAILSAQTTNPTSTKRSPFSKLASPSRNWRSEDARRCVSAQ